MFKKPGISGQMQNWPEMQALHNLLSQALENRGRQMQLNWRSPGMQFTLVLVCNVRGDPRWCLYSDQQGKRQLVFDYSSCDVLLVKNLIASSCTELHKSGKSPFLSSNRNKAAAPEPSAGVAEVIDSELYPPIEEQRSLPQPPQPVAHQSLSAPAFTGERGPQSFGGQAPPQVSNDPFASVVNVPPVAMPQTFVPAAKPKTGSTFAPDEKLNLQPKFIDGSAIEEIMLSLRHQDTGMFLYPAFLYFLEQEYFRSLRSRSSLSVIILALRDISDGQKRHLSDAAIIDAVIRITELKRHVDILAHYDEGECILLLPNTRTLGARTFAERLLKSLTEKPLGGIEPSNLSMAFGSASMPEDFVDLGKFLGAAELAAQRARDTGTSLVLFHDIREHVIAPD